LPSLFVIQGRDQGCRFDLRETHIRIGRDPQNDICLQDHEASRYHAELKWSSEHGGYELIDLESSNGCFINSHRVARAALQGGDRIQIGRSLMIYTGVEDASLREIADSVDISSHLEGDEAVIVRALAEDASDHELDATENDWVNAPGESQWLARARSNLQVMYRTALAVSHTLDIDQLLTRIMELIFEWVEADRGCILLVEGPEEKLVPKVRRNHTAVRPGDRLAISSTILDYVLAHREGVLTSDARDDDRWDAGGSIVKLGVREAICVPMRGRYGNVGVIYVDTYIPPGAVLKTGLSRKFREEHLKLLIAIGHQAALAVEDTKYYSAMVQAERLAAVGQTIAGLSHHIKNILQGMNGGSYLVDQGIKGEDLSMVGKGWSIVQRNQDRVSRLVLDMLTFSKERRPEFAPADLLSIVQDAVELMKSRADESNVTLTCQYQTPIGPVDCDADAVSHAVLNVITNAIDACNDRENAAVEVVVSQAAAGGDVRIVVRDNGEGIPEERIQRIFEPFESSKGNRGTGLGLAVTQKIIREHGGEVSVTSQFGSGSEFILSLPTSHPEGGPTTVI
jgi:two-component system, NtrC family, sensor kinase